MKVSIQGLRLNDDGTTWVRCWPVELEARAAAEAAGVTSYTATVAFGDLTKRVTIGSTLVGLVPVGEPADRRDGHGRTQRLDGTISEICLRRVAGVAANVAVTEA
jgi:hypothetical protein